MKNNFIIAVILLLLFGCKTVEFEQPGIDQAIFSFDGLINGDSISLVAGEADNYLFTSSYLDDNNVSVFFGELGNVEECPGNCPGSLTIEFRNNSEAVEVDNDLISPQNKKYYNGLVDESAAVITQIEVILENKSFSNESLSYNWDFGNGQQSNLQFPDPVVYFVPDMNNNEAKVTLSVTSTSGCTATRTKSIVLGPPVISPSCQLALDYAEGVGPSSLQLCAEMLQSPPSVITWNYLDEQIDEPCLYLELQETTAEVNATNSVGCTITQFIEIFPTDNAELAVCQAEFEISGGEDINQSDEIDSIGLGAINIKYTDLQGITYQSGLITNQAENEFTILTSEVHDLNENGKATQLFTFEFDAWLASENGEVINITNATGTWAIAKE